MVLGEAAAASAAGAHALWDYNRSNYLYDREMRQEQEFQILEYRNRQAELWREDVRDLIGLTEQKMDSYLVVGTLQLGMCVMLFTEGRLEPGTPHWLLRLYMLTLGAAFAYLLMSIWLAMHASVVAQSSSVRLLTQLVRLPVPSWEQLEATRTYAASYEELHAAQVLRVPFVGSVVGAGEQRGEAAADPWGLEPEGRDIYELQHRPSALLRHVKLVRRAAAQYQCYDAFARVSMMLGTNQLLFAVTYYCLGYAAVEDGAPWPAWSVAVVMMAMALGLVRQDLSLTPRERWVTQALIVSGPACASLACCAWTVYSVTSTLAARLLLPLAFLAHGLWLAWALRCCGVQKQPDGAMLPTKFRAVLYLDVFGWLSKKGARRPAADEDANSAAGSAGVDARAVAAEESWASGPASPSSSRQASLRRREDQLRRDVALWESEKVQGLVDEGDRERIGSLAQQFRAALGQDGTRAEASESFVGQAPLTPPPPPARWLRLRGYADTGEEVVYLWDANSSAVLQLDERQGAASASSAAAGHRRQSGPPAPDAAPPMSLSFTEERVQSFCERQAAAAAAPAAAAPPASATASRSLLDWCEEPQRAPEGSRTVPRRDSPVARATATGGGERQAAHRSMSYPQPRRDAPSRPEDLEAATEREREAHLSQIEHGIHDDWRVLRGVGPAAAVPSAAHDAFHPTSFYPEGYAAAGDMHLAGDGEEVVTGHDKSPPGQLPWQAFSAATRLFVGCWVVACSLSIPGVDSHFGLRILTLPQVMASLLRETGSGLGRHGRHHNGVGGSILEDRQPLLAALSERHRDPDLPALPEGEAVGVEWPRHFSFVPRMLGCDPSGRHLVVADEFGIYAGEVGEAAEEALPTVAGAAASAGAAVASTGALGHSPAAGGAGAPSLRRGRREAQAAAWAPSSTPAPGAAAAPRRRLSARFRREPPCTVLEGQMLKDIGLVCSKGASCHVLVLHAHGRRIAECPLSAELPPATVEVSTSGPSGGSRQLPPATDGGLPGIVGAAPSPPLPRIVRPNLMWEISGGWLNATKERVESVAVDGQCGGEDSFMPDDPGCLIVGTTSGRIVQLRRHVSDKHQLVPEWAMGRRSGKVGQGSLHVLDGFVMALRPGLGTVQALDAWEGTEVGEWQLPPGIEWCALGAGGDSLYVLGCRGSGREAVLWRFPIPVELQERRRRQLQPHMSSGTGSRYHEM